MPFRFFSRVDMVLRRSLGVSETATVDETVKPAPPIERDLPEVEEPPAPVFNGEFGDGKVILPDDVKDPVSVFVLLF